MTHQDRSGVRRHCTYANVMSTLAVFLVVAGGTALAAKLPSGSVASKTVKDNSLQSKDLKNGSAVTGADVRDDSLGGSDVDESDLRVDTSPTGAASGGLSGSYPNPAIGASAVGSAQIAPDSVGADDIATDSVGSAEIDAPLSAGDVALSSGMEVLDFDTVAASACETQTINTGAEVDGNTVAVTPDDGFSTALSVSVSDSNASNAFRVNVCNPTAVVVDSNGPASFSYVVFDVAEAI